MIGSVSFSRHTRLLHSAGFSNYDAAKVTVQVGQSGLVQRLYWPSATSYTENPSHSGRALGSFFSPRVRNVSESPLRFLSNRHRGFLLQRSSDRDAEVTNHLRTVYMLNVWISTLMPHTCPQLITLPQTGYCTGSHLENLHGRHVGILVITFLFSRGLKENQSEHAMQQHKGRPAQSAFRQVPIGSRCTGLNSINVAKSIVSFEPLIFRGYAEKMWQYWTNLKAGVTKLPYDSRTTRQTRRRLPQTPTMIGCCISQTKSNFTRNVNENMKLEHPKLPNMWITSL